MSTAETGMMGSRPGDLHRRRVVLVAESAGMAAVLNQLLDPTDRLSRLGSLRELAESRSLDAADVVVLDVPAEERAAVVGQVRRRHLGPLVVVVAKGEHTRGLRLDDACAVLTRPFSADELGASLSVAGGPPTPARTTPAPPGRLGLIERARRLLVTLTLAWQARRRVRVAGFSVLALVAFTVAFARAAQGAHCGPGCDAFGTVFSPEPTVAPASRAPSTTGPKRSTTTTAPSGSPGTGAFRGVSGGRVAITTTTERRDPATTRPATTAPPTTAPTTTVPPTTAPTTTAPPTTAPTTTAGA
ncbi:MAG TPA: hypothetical protein VFS70_07730 [Actinomycetota bacterium]|nr:hypothetical protein [Actinomycetota bacterium]